MAFQITITEDADRQFRSLPARDQRTLKTAIAARLEHQPTAVSKAIKRLRPNPLAQYELRAAGLRALYKVEGNEVVEK
jgi:mRNA-degrading endonuclease RelE of RelBE toxin-antitoxin system